MNGADVPEAPIPSPDELTIGFWEELRTHNRLAIQYCSACAHYQHFPEPVCILCGSDQHLLFRPVSGKGTVYSYVVSYQTRIRGLSSQVPYVIAWVELPEQAGLRIITNVRNCPPTSVRVGMEVRLTLERRGEWVLPQFEPL